MDLRVIVEPQQGASYLQQLTVAQTAEELGFDAFFRSDHCLKMGDVERAARPDRHVGHARRPSPGRPSTIRLGTLVTLGHVPPARPARHRRGPGRRHERRSGRARPRRRLVRRRAHRLRHPVPRPRSERFDRLEEQLEILTGLWHTPGRLAVLVRGRALRPRRLAGAAQAAAARRAADHHRRPRARRARPAWPPGTPASSTCRSPRSRTFATQRERVQTACEERRPRPGVDDLLGGPDAVLRRERRRGRAPGRQHRPSRRRAAPATAPPAHRRRCSTRSPPTPRPGAERIYLQVLDLDDLDHLRLVADQVMRLIP